MNLVCLSICKQTVYSRDRGPCKAAYQPDPNDWQGDISCFRDNHKNHIFCASNLGVNLVFSIHVFDSLSSRRAANAHSPVMDLRVNIALVKNSSNDGLSTAKGIAMYMHMRASAWNIGKAVFTRYIAPLMAG